MRRQRDNPLSIRHKSFRRLEVEDPLAQLLALSGQRKERLFGDRPEPSVRWEPPARRRRWLLLLSWLFLIAGLIGIGIYVYVTLDARLYQATEEQKFEQERKAAQAQPAAPQQQAGPQQQAPAAQPARKVRRPHEMIGRVEIPRLRVAAMVREGYDETTLRRAVGHITGTAYPGEQGNAALAGHRDSFFRGLRNVHKNDVITFSTVDGTYRYKVDSIRIVGPKDVKVLQATGEPTLTLVTCYPFSYFGHAPERFVVQARQLGSDDSNTVVPASHERTAQPGEDRGASRKASRPRTGRRRTALQRARLHARTALMGTGEPRRGS